MYVVKCYVILKHLTKCVTLYYYEDDLPESNLNQLHLSILTGQILLCTKGAVIVTVFYGKFQEQTSFPLLNLTGKNSFTYTMTAPLLHRKLEKYTE